ncbi:Rieske 2Fe-2S domain-containing protein [Ramlibacter sp. AW1]|uniref:Rieske 2Fe-2S domain-containing protein n=1 Tax=Ramlibacter aurantiacus TaxID=2801330 RepID=A0A936ZKV6_9BURK|nr:Rieske 2Fe-2S domain-containing protein [Ramlibacter aurantiacus]MBL0422068.1 Rieske 2Fe-2S domain-containing protein [Ramlibacter aurantiacus]
MDRRAFVRTCTASAAGLSLANLPPAMAAMDRPNEHAKAVLVDREGRPLRASSLRPQTNYLFHYPFESTPVLLLDLGRAVAPQSVAASSGQDSYAWPGGVGARQAIVAFSAICSHKLVYPTRNVNFISFRSQRARRGVQDGLIHCCADHSQYDPGQAARVVAGPAPTPLAAILLTYDSHTDTLTAYGTLGSELFDEFFQRYQAKLALEHGPTARQEVSGQARVWELEQYTRNNMTC